MTFKLGHFHSDETKAKISAARSKKITFNCDMCGSIAFDKPSSYDRKNRHFCGKKCYADYRKNVMQPHEQNSYKGGGLSSEDKKIRLKARSDLNHAIRKGKIVRSPCVICGEKKSEGHH